MRISDWSSDVCSSDLKDVIFDIDVEGGLRLKRKYPDFALAIFVQPPSLAALKERLADRGTDTPEKLEERIRKASKELSYAPFFDVVRSEEHTSELQSLMRISYAVFCLKKKTKN